MIALTFWKCTARTGLGMMICAALAALVAGCAGTYTSSTPVYPKDWPARLTSEDASGCPDLSGTYRAVSEPAAPLVYPPGGAPAEMAFLVPYAKAKTPPLGRRMLAWHLAGKFGPNDPLLHDLKRFAAAINDADAAWVRVLPGVDGKINVTCGLRHEAIVRFDLAPRNPDKSEFWNYQPGYICRNGSLIVRGVFPVPAAERGHTNNEDPHAAGVFTFSRATDGSLVMLEDLYWSQGQEVVFAKWWRWRRIGP